jgi:succinoglycan biosynthesis protein ExoA
MTTPTVSVVIPTYREEGHVEACLAAVARQTYPKVVEVLVVDGRSDDRTRELALATGATVLDNPRRIQAAALNVGLEAAKGDVIVRVDGHCVIADDYVERCVEVLEATGAAVVGGAMTPVATTPTQRAIAMAMSSPLGAGPARFHIGGAAGWVDTVYLGAYRTAEALAIGGYATDVGVNEDAEFAHRMRTRGGVWFDPAIRSTYVPRDSVRSVARQFWRYGRSRAMTARRHPSSVTARQLVAPALVIGLALPTRRVVAPLYLMAVLAVVVRGTRRIGLDALRLGAILPTMHLSWGLGLLAGVARGRPRDAAPRRGSDSDDEARA